MPHRIRFLTTFARPEGERRKCFDLFRFSPHKVCLHVPSSGSHRMGDSHGFPLFFVQKFRLPHKRIAKMTTFAQNFTKNQKKRDDMPETMTIPIKQLEVNKGQIEGLPQNPRFIRDQRYEALKKSIQDAPEMLSLRELLVMPHGRKYVIVGGNMRLRACKDLGYEEVPCKVLDKDTPVEKLREYAIKDNNGFGEDDWDILANEWDEVELQEWGMEIPSQYEEPDFDSSEDKEKKQVLLCCPKCGFEWQK